MGRNERLAAVIAETGASYETIARDLRVLAGQNGIDDLLRCGRSHVGHWVAGTRPSRHAPGLLAEVLSRRLGRVVSVVDIGLADATTGKGSPDPIDVIWSQDAVMVLLKIGRADVRRRTFAKHALYSLAALALPVERWQEIAQRGTVAARGRSRVGRSDIAAVQDMLSLLQSADERLGGDHARLAIAQYLTTDVAAFLTGRFATSQDRRDMFSAASELTFVAGWKAFDSDVHGLAQRYYLASVRLAAEVDDRALGAYVLRALAHQAADLGHGRQCVDLSDAALTLSGPGATPGTLALLTILRARGVALLGDRRLTTATISDAETLLSKSDPRTEPGWLRAIGFGEAVIASQAAQALSAARDHAGAEAQFRRSITARDVVAYPRVHALTLAGLAEQQARVGNIGHAVATWNQCLDCVTGVRSGRVHRAILGIQQHLRVLGSRLPSDGRQLRQRVEAELRLRA